MRGETTKAAGHQKLTHRHVPAGTNRSVSFTVAGGL